MSQNTDFTGGDGIPRRRGADFPKDVFLIRPDDKEYLIGRKPEPKAKEYESENLKTFLVGALLSFLLFIVVFFDGFRIFQRQPIEGFFVIGVWIWFPIVGIRWFLISGQRLRLTKRGILLVGQIVDITTKWKIEGRHYAYFVTVAYCLQTPDGRTIRGSDTAVYMDMVGKPLPIPGTPVAVLYISDEDKMLL